MAHLFFCRFQSNSYLILAYFISILENQMEEKNKKKLDDSQSVPHFIYTLDKMGQQLCISMR